MKTYIIPILLTLAILCSGQLGQMYISSLKTDASMNQVKTGENAVLERTFIQTNTSQWIFLTQGVLICAIWVSFYVRKNKNETKTTNPS